MKRLRWRLALWVMAKEDRAFYSDAAYRLLKCKLGERERNRNDH